MLHLTLVPCAVQCTTLQLRDNLHVPLHGLVGSVWWQLLSVSKVVLLKQLLFSKIPTSNSLTPILTCLRSETMFQVEKKCSAALCTVSEINVGSSKCPSFAHAEMGLS